MGMARWCLGAGRSVARYVGQVGHLGHLRHVGNLGHVAGGVVAAAMAASAAAQGLTTVSFDALPAGSFSSYTEDGFAVAALTSNWKRDRSPRTNGAPDFWLAIRNKGAAGISVTHGGDIFQFTSVGLYSSTTTIPYVIQGYLAGQLVFEHAAVQFRGQSAFVQVASPSAAFIDQLTVSLTNTVAVNDMGLDNLSFNVVSAVPEPPVWLLGALGVAALAGGRTVQRRRAGAQIR